MDKVSRSFGTHSGSFHADEVTACALMLFFDLIDRDKIRRTRDPEVLASCEFVCDVGGVYDPSKKLFDHHQVEYQGMLSSAGMVLRYLKEEKYLSEKLFNFFELSLMKGVDAIDNGFDPHIEGLCTFSQVINNFNPVRHQAPHEEQNRCFFEALDFALGHLSRLKERFDYIESCRADVAERMRPRDKVLIFDKSLPWQELFFDMGGEEHPALFVVMPSGDHWKLRGIPPSMADRMAVRLPLPEEWAGLHDEDLQKASGIKGAIFCHKGRFISVWETREDALKALGVILNE
ncbi:MAG: MYG1 family protein [Chlamydiia bacterium]|nr:MYG1 family protein [Chlamydiia bacterium]